MKKTKVYWNTLIHRDLGYFFLGIIIAFSASGIILNHREDIDSQKYTLQTEVIQIELPGEKASITDDFFKNILTHKNIIEEYRGFKIKDHEIRVYLKDAVVTIDASTGAGEIEYLRTIPVLGHMTILHKSTNKWWIWFSDIFGISILIIAIARLFISKQEDSFKNHGWELILFGLIFPFIFLFLIN